MTAELHARRPFDRTAAALLKYVRVEGLFGRYTYSISAPRDGDERLLLIHGDNGSGKTTLLRLIWNLLSPSDRRGHRTYLARTPFSELLVELSNEESIKVQKIDGLLGSFRVTVSSPYRPTITDVYEADENLRIRSASEDFDLVEAFEQGALWGSGPGEMGESRVRFRAKNAPRRQGSNFITYLEGLNINPLFLADDRSVYSDDPDLERMRERAISVEEGRVRRHQIESTETAVSRELRLTLRRVTDLFRTLMLGGQTSGSAGANTIYGQVLTQLAAASAGASSAQVAHDSGAVFSMLQQLKENSPRYEEFGFVPHFDADNFLRLYESIPPERKDIAATVLQPFLTSLSARYEALYEPERKLRTLIHLANAFLTDKRLTFNPSEGISIIIEDGSALPTESLSSGERQVIMLLCTTLLAGTDSHLFIIDEPELSLGATWQRNVLQALLNLTWGSSLQFVIATHSIEVMSGQPESVVTLRNEDRGQSSVF